MTDLERLAYIAVLGHSQSRMSMQAMTLLMGHKEKHFWGWGSMWSCAHGQPALGKGYDFVQYSDKH
eukprot:jgi/Botrbrau1/23512/Bobra.106_1s0062.1